jgi:hypothetical protein
MGDTGEAFDVFGPDNYHDDWSDLMPVVEKIEKTKVGNYYAFPVKIMNRFCCVECHEANYRPGIIYQTPYGHNPDSKIEAVYKAVIEFIEWYNNNKQP